MLCEICQLIFSTKRNIHNLFEPETHHICESCYMKYPLFPSQRMYPIDHYQIVHMILSERSYEQNPQAYMSFLKPYYVTYLKHFTHCIILYFDILDEYTVTLLEPLKLGDLYIISLYENIEDKGE